MVYFFIAIILALIIIPFILLMNYFSNRKKIQNKILAKEHYRKSIGCIQDEKYNDAKTHLRKAVFLDPENSKYREMIKTLNAGGKFEDIKIKTTKPEYKEREISIAGVEIQEINDVVNTIKKRQKASKMKKEERKKKFTSEDIRRVNELYKEAERLFTTGKYSMALPLYQQIIRNYPGSDKEILVQNRLVAVINYLKKDLK